MNADYHPPYLNRRRGAVLICMLACCLTALSLSAISMQLALRSARESKHVLKLRQAEWLLNAGVLRAKNNLQDAQYTGETWDMPATVTRSDAAVVRITVEPNAQAIESESSIVTITAVSGTSPNTLQRSCQLTVAKPRGRR